MPARVRRETTPADHLARLDAERMRHIEATGKCLDRITVSSATRFAIGPNKLDEWGRKYGVEVWIG